MARPCGPGEGCTKAKASAFVSSFWRTELFPTSRSGSCSRLCDLPSRFEHSPAAGSGHNQQGLGMPPTTNSTRQRGTLPPCSSAKWEAEGGPCPPASSFARSPPTHGLSHASARLLRSPPDLARPRPLNQAVASTDRPLPWQPCRLKRPPSQVNSDSADSALPSVAAHVAGLTPVRPRGPLHRDWHSTYEGVVLTGSTSAAGRPAATARACIH